MVTYKKITYDSSKVQVESAIRDGAGRQIDTNYVRSATAVAGSDIATVGTPSVDASVSNGTMTLTFHKLKGAKGDTGATGPQGPAGPAGSYTIAAGSGLINTNNALSVNTGYTTSGKNYAVQKNSSGQLYVNVPWTDNNDDTKVTQAYSTTSNSYPLLMSATAGVTSTSSRGNTTSILNNQLYANPSTGALYSKSLETSEIKLKDPDGYRLGIDSIIYPNQVAQYVANGNPSLAATEKSYFVQSATGFYFVYHPSNGSNTQILTVNAVGPNSTPYLSFSGKVTGTSGNITSYDADFVTGSTVYNALSSYAPKASPAFTGTPTAPTATAGTNTTQIATTAFVKTAADNLKSEIGTPMHYKGAWTSNNSLPSNPATGDTYRATVDGSVENVATWEAGDTLVYGASAWDVIPSGDEPTGTVTHSGSVTSGHIAVFDGTTGDVIKDGGAIDGVYLKLSGGTMTGVLKVKGAMYEDAYNGALNMNNSDIFGLNSIYTADKADSSAEGIHFYCTATTVDTFWVKDGNYYVTPNRTLGQAGTSYKIYHEGNLKSETAAASGTTLSLVTTGEKATWNAKTSNTGTVTPNGTIAAGHLAKFKDTTGNVIQDCGYPLTTIANAVNPQGTIPVVKSDGVIEIGKYIDFHENAPTTPIDYTLRLTCPALTTPVAINLPSSAGTLALTSQLVRNDASGTATDPSNALTNGFWRVASTTTDSANASWNPFLTLHSDSDFKIITTADTNNWAQQIATDYRTDAVMYRVKTNGTWTKWNPIRYQGCWAGHSGQRNWDNSANGVTGLWYKLGSVKIATSYKDINLRLRVYSGYSDRGKASGILSVHVRGGQYQTEQTDIRWEYALDGIDPNRFCLLYTTPVSGQSTLVTQTYELWYYNSAAWQLYRFEPFIDGTGGTMEPNWLFTDNRGDTEVAGSRLRELEGAYNFTAYCTNNNFTRQYSVKADIITGKINGYTLAAASGYAVETTLANDSKLPTGAAVTTALGNYLPLTGGTLTGTLYVQSNTGSYCEGIRINRASSGWATLMIGCTQGSTSGMSSGWSIHRDTSGRFLISNKDSTYSTALFYGTYASNRHTMTVPHDFVAGTINGLTVTKAATGFTIAGGTTSKTLTVSETYTLGAACAKAVDTSISAASTSVNLPTSAAVATFVEGKGYLTSHQTIVQDGITGATVTRYASCTTAAGTAAKTASVTNGTFALGTGARVTVKFSNKNTANSPTLNINSTGAKNIYHNGAQITSGTNKGMLYGACDFVYDGTQWLLVGNYVDTNDSVKQTPLNSGSFTGNNYGILCTYSEGGTSAYTGQTVFDSRTFLDASTISTLHTEGLVLTPNTSSSPNTSLSIIPVAGGSAGYYSYNVNASSTQYLTGIHVNLKMYTTSPTDSTMATRNIAVSTSAPTSSDGSNGDIWIVYE